MRKPLDKLFVIFALVMLTSCSDGTTATGMETLATSSAPILEQTLTSTKTFVASTDTPGQISQVNHEKSFILFFGYPYPPETGYIQDLNSGSVHQLKTGEINAFLGWLKNGCSALVQLSDGSIVEIDLYGNILKEYLSSDAVPSNHDNAAYGYPSLSPDFQWFLTFRTAHDQSGWTLTRDIEIKRLDQPGEIYFSTQGRWVETAQWSHNASWLAYSDLDAGEVSQLYLVNLTDLSLRQITAFTEPGWQINSIHWSPTSDKIAFEHRLLGDFIEEVGYEIKETKIVVVDLDRGEQIVQVIEHDGIRWWDSSDVLVTGSLKWINISTGEVERELPRETAVGEMYLIRKMGNSLNLGFFSEDESFYTVDINTLEVTHFPHIKRLSEPFGSQIFIVDWVSSPDNFPGVANCP